jgi:hypothetical protein
VCYAIRSVASSDCPVTAEFVLKETDTMSCNLLRSSVIKLKTKLRCLSPQANYTHRATAAVGEVMTTFAGRGYYVVSATDSHGR